MAGNSILYRAETNPTDLLAWLPSIKALGDANKEALSFWPEPAYRDAINNRRLIAMLGVDGASSTLAGYIISSGVFPNAKVQQIAVDPAHRRAQIGSALINLLIESLEIAGFQIVTAAVASDLPEAQAFYERQGFTVRHTKRGGAARGRTIILRARDIENKNLFSGLDNDVGDNVAAELGLLSRARSAAPLYAIDLNVLFDAIKGPGRTRAPFAEKLLGAALNHDFRLAIAPEFIVELERFSSGEKVDPVLTLAKRLPRLSPVDAITCDALARTIHDIVFVRANYAEAGSPQALSDARHLAQAALGRVAGYVTSDGKLLAARTVLRAQIGIDVASLEEFVEMLTDEADVVPEVRLRDSRCKISPVEIEIIRQYLQSEGVPQRIVNEFCPAVAATRAALAVALFESDVIKGCAVLNPPASVDAASRALVHARHDQVNCEALTDKLIDIVNEEACRTAPATIELCCAPGQIVVRNGARQRGHMNTAIPDVLIKIAVGRPITPSSWDALVRQINRRAGVSLPYTPLPADASTEGLSIVGSNGVSARVRLQSIERALSPTVIAWPGRDGAIVPIAKVYADAMLGTSNQFDLFGELAAALFERKTYVCTPRAEAVLRPGRPILFYESSRTGGCGAVIAAGVIADTVLSKKEDISGEVMKRAVVEDLEGFSTSPDILAVSFVSTLRFPRRVPLEVLQQLGAAGTNNLQTASKLSADRLAAVLDYGWARD